MVGIGHGTQVSSRLVGVRGAVTANIDVSENANAGSVDGIVTTVDRHGVARLTISRPERMNALDTAATRTIMERLTAWSSDPAVRVIVIDGAGGSFSTGADVVSIAHGGGLDGLTAESAREIISAGTDLARAVRAVPVPVVASVDGAAAGIGASLAFASDLVYATERSYFLLAFINIGLMPDGGATMSVAASVGRARANALAMLGEKLHAQAAFDAGLITETLADRAALDAKVEAVAAKLAVTSPAALRLTKAAVDAHTMAGMDAALERELRGQTELLQSDEFRAALAAFTGRR
ncbi:enoyl-CoA hydratase [Gordonia desulfuricans]|uniref:Enoyl-CoA hydratase n=1 Tax=Gordonia desulfuricans TaxID=89051 RepID=A0A7K3LJL6_9ACTN|nr:enoyl-CoA hydratase [Gordonia desulfuricans]